MNPTPFFKIIFLIIAAAAFNICHAIKSQNHVIINKIEDSKKDSVGQIVDSNQSFTFLPSLDIERVMKECRVMIYIEKEKDKARNQLERKAEEFENRLRILQEKIKLAHSKGETTEAELTKMQQDFDSEEAECHSKLNTIYKHSEKVFNKVEEDVLNIVMDESSKVAQEKNYKFVVNKSILLICDNVFDITQNVLDAVNKRIETIPIDLSK